MKFLGVPSSGSIAGTTSSHNRAGQYTRNRRAPVQPIGTGRRSTIRAAFGAASAAWASLSTADQGAWTSYAAAHPITDALGQSITLTGQQMYVSINTSLQNVGQPQSVTPPADSSTTAPTGLALTATSGGTPAMSLAFTPPPTGDFLTVQFSAQLSNGVSFNATWWQAEVLASTTTSPSNVLAKYIAQFGTLISGMKVFARITPVNQYGVVGTAVVVSTQIA